MSGYLGLAAGSAALLLSQPAPLIIGSLILQGYEVPGRITIGGSQSVRIHKLPGGGRIIDAMGPDSGAIAWRGLFVGPDAARRARTLDTMRIQGIPQILSFGDYIFNVVVINCEYDYQNQGSIIDYRIKAEIVLDPSNLNSVVADIDLALQDDLGSSQALLKNAAAAALTYAALAGKSDAAQITASAFSLNTISADIGATALIGQVVTLSALPRSQVIQEKLQTIGTKMQTNINSLSAKSTLPLDLSLANVSALATSTAQAAALAGLIQAGSYVNRAHTNIMSPNGQIAAPLVHA